MRRLLRNFALSTILACSGLHAVAQSASPLPASMLLAQNARISMADATNLVQRQTGGRVLNAQAARQDRREGYRIKVLTESGEVRVFFVDAQSGALQQN